MQFFTKRYISFWLLFFLAFSTGKIFGQTGVLNPNDSVYVYNPSKPPTTPPYGTLVKWVKTNRVSYNTNTFKCYFYDGVCFRLMFPKSYVPGNGKIYPLYMFFHGIGEWGTIYDNENQLTHGGNVHQAAVKNGTFDGFLLYPQSSSSTGFFGNDDYIAMQQLIINHLIPEVQVDPNRILVDGLSGGGQAAWVSR